MATLLVVDDDPKIRKMLRRYLTGEGFTVFEADGGDAMRQVMLDQPVDLVLLDLQMPGDDGLFLAKEVRKTSNIGIIMITGKGAMVDRIVGLEMGADDYLPKPFHLREVLARVRSVLRRTGGATPVTESRSQMDEEAGSDGFFHFAGWTLDPGSRRLRSPEGSDVALTGAEYDLLLVFLKAPNVVLSRDALLDRLTGRDWTPYDRSIDTRVMRLRRKLQGVDGKLELIKTVRGAGYTFATPVSNS